MVSASTSESNGLALVCDVLVETFIGEAAIVSISMVDLDGTPGLRKDLLVGLLCRQGFFKGKIFH